MAVTDISASDIPGWNRTEGVQQADPQVNPAKNSYFQMFFPGVNTWRCYVYTTYVYKSSEKRPIVVVSLCFP